MTDFVAFLLMGHKDASTRLSQGDDTTETCPSVCQSKTGYGLACQRGKGHEGRNVHTARTGKGDVVMWFDDGDDASKE